MLFYEEDKYRVKISTAIMYQRFTPCMKYIKKCKGVCWRNNSGELNVTVAPSEVAHIKKLGGVIKQGFLRARKGERWCPFQDDNGYCKIHMRKPIGCAASPFKLNKNNTLIVRRRYLSLNCHKDARLPAYHVFFNSLIIMFGEQTAHEIEEQLRYRPARDFYRSMIPEVFDALKYNDKLRNG